LHEGQAVSVELTGVVRSERRDKEGDGSKEGGVCNGRTGDGAEGSRGIPPTHGERLLIGNQLERQCEEASAKLHAASRYELDLVLPAQTVDKESRAARGSNVEAAIHQVEHLGPACSEHGLGDRDWRAFSNDQGLVGTKAPCAEDAEDRFCTLVAPRQHGLNLLVTYGYNVR
jgi:hypothetical protein